MSYITNTSIVLAIIAFVFFIFKNYIIQYITKSVAHHYDKEIENFRSIIQERQTEQKQFHDLLMHTVTHENKELKQRKISAVDNLWKSFLSYKALSAGVKFLSTLNMQNILKHASNPKIQQFISIFRRCCVNH